MTAKIAKIHDGKLERNKEARLEKIVYNNASIIRLCSDAVAAGGSQEAVLNSIIALARESGYLADKIIRDNGSAGCYGDFEDWLAIDNPDFKQI